MHSDSFAARRLGPTVERNHKNACISSQNAMIINSFLHAKRGNSVDNSIAFHCFLLITQVPSPRRGEFAKALGANSCCLGWNQCEGNECYDSLYWKDSWRLTCESSQRDKGRFKVNLSLSRLSITLKFPVRCSVLPAREFSF